MLFEKSTFRVNIVISFILRIFLIIYGEYQDHFSGIKYTDIDYKVVTDGARYILQGKTPFLRHTYRYSPILSYLMIPNILIYDGFGKLVFSLIDIFAGILIKKIVFKAGNYKFETLANDAGYFWLYNPLEMIISTRGNGDSFSSILVLLTIYFLTNTRTNYMNTLVASICFGFAIHIRLYPLIYSLAIFLSMSNHQNLSLKNFLRILLFPNKQQIILILGTLITFFSSSALFYYLYGFQYIYEAYLYHSIRKDTRHNFSLFFLMQYLQSSQKITTIQKLITSLPILILIFILSIKFGSMRNMLPFCIFCQTFIMVSYNTVVTSQYFIWYLAILPLCINNLQLNVLQAILLLCLWLFGQGLWLFSAYYLEFKSYNTFNLIGFQGIIFFFINMFILYNIIISYTFKK